MKCPACKTELTQMQVEDLTVDVCKSGCGGIWFDNYEINKVDEKHECIGELLLQVEKRPDISINHQELRLCPVCEDQKMLQHFMSVKRDVTVDECPNCGGLWLDAGELGQIRNQFDTDTERSQAADDYFDRVFDQDLNAMLEKSEAAKQSARKIAHIFRFLLPSYYIRGKQRWGAY